MSVNFNKAFENLFNGTFDIDTLSIRCALAMDNSTDDPATEIDADTLSAMFGGSGFSSVEMDGANYARQVLANVTNTRDDTNDLVKLSADNYTISSLGAGTNAIMGALIYAHVTNDADSWPIAWIPYATNQTADGSDFPVNFHADGFFRVTQAAGSTDVRFFNTFKDKLVKGDFAFTTLDVRAALSMNTSGANDCMNETDEDFLDQFFSAAGFTDVEMDGANYARTALATKAVVLDDTNDQARLTADDITLSSLGAGTNNVNGVLIFAHVTNDTDSWPICYRKYNPEQTPNGSDFDIEWGSNGVLRIA